MAEFLKEIAMNTQQNENSRNQVVQFLNRRFPGSQGKHSEKEIRRGIKALEREARDLEIGALEREFQ
jgi:hypothetical protein